VNWAGKKTSADSVVVLLRPFSPQLAVCVIHP
jgi:hypothetical protein